MSPRIAQLANFVTPTSGGLRTVLGRLAEGYAAAGHDVLQVIPGPVHEVEQSPWGHIVRLPGTVLPGTGYRILANPRRVQDVLAGWAPDRLEVHDRTTLRGLGGWAGRQGLPSLVVSHERLDRWLAQWMPRSLPLRAAALRSAADATNAALASSFDQVVCTTTWAAQEFTRLGVDVRIVALGVDLQAFPARLYGDGHRDIRLVTATRLSREKRPELAIETLRELCRRGLDASLVVCGDGPMRASLHRVAADLPVTWRGFVSDRDELAEEYAHADVALALGPIETFGLAALEAMACGTPTVVNRNSALPDLVGSAGRAVPSSGWCAAEAVLHLLSEDEPVRRHAARHRVERFRWADTVRGFLDVHRLDPTHLGVAA